MSSDQKKPISRVELDLLLKRARELAKSEPQKAAIVLTEWLNRPRKLDNIREEKPIVRKKAG